MRICLSSCKPAEPLVSLPGGLSTESPFITRRAIRKDKVVVVMGATGTGKSRLSIDLATRFPAEVINSDKMQVYKGLDIVTNKITEQECRGIPHHLLGVTDPNVDFTAVDFRRQASSAVESIVRRDRIPIIAGGSNSYIKALVNDDFEFRSKYDFCFLWVDVSLPVLHSVVSERVDRMVDAGLVNEVRGIFNPEVVDYIHGIRRAIGVPEMDQFLRAETNLSNSYSDNMAKHVLLKKAIENIKANTCKLACRQLGNILRLQTQLKWKIHRLDATQVFLKQQDEEETDEAWEELVVGPSTCIVDRFLHQQGPNRPGAASPATTIRWTRPPVVAAATV